MLQADILCQLCRTVRVSAAATGRWSLNTGVHYLHSCEYVMSVQGGDVSLQPLMRYRLTAVAEWDPSHSLTNAQLSHTHKKQPDKNAPSSQCPQRTSNVLAVTGAKDCRVRMIPVMMHLNPFIPGVPLENGYYGKYLGNKEETFNIYEGELLI